MELLDGPAPVVVVTSDDGLLEHLLAVTAALLLEPVVVEPNVLRGRWGAAAVVIVGLDRAPEVAGLVLPRRTDLYLLSGEGDLEEACDWSGRLGAAVLTLPRGADALSAALSGASGPRSRTGRLVCVVGGSGGAGASTCAAGLAVVAARAGHSVALVDVDERGGGLDLLLGAEETAGWRWPRLAGARGVLGDLGGQLPQVCGVDLLAMGREPHAARPLTAEQTGTVLRSLVRSHEVVVVDVPRAVGSAGWEALRRSDSALVVARSDLRGVVAARELVRELAPGCGSMSLLVRQGRTRGLGPAAVAAAVELPLVGVLRDDDGLARAAERGDPPGRATRSTLARTCRQVLGTLLAPPVTSAPAAAPVPSAEPVPSAQPARRVA